MVETGCGCPKDYKPMTIEECARIIHQRKCFGDIKDDMKGNKEANNGKD